MRLTSKIVVFANDEKYPAEIIRTNDKADLAIISIDAVLDKQQLTLSEAGLFSTVYAAGYPGSKAYDHSIYFDKSTGMAVTENRRKEEPKIVKNKPQKTRKHTKPRCGKKKIMV